MSVFVDGFDIFESLEHSKPLPLEYPEDEIWPSDDEYSQDSRIPTPHSYFKRRITDDLNGDCEPPRKRIKFSVSPSEAVKYTPLRLPLRRDDFLDFCHRPETVFVDKTRVLFQLPDRFRYLLLRPHEFGKTTFLSAMSKFYDIHGADRFSEYFETGPENGSGSSHSQHLCLCLRFWGKRVRYQLVYSLRPFLVKYKTELGLSDSEPYTYVDWENDEPLRKVLDLVRSRGKTLFVGVDDYDAPFREESPSNQDFAQLLDKHIWSPLQANADIVPKLFVTGTFSLQTPVLRKLVVPAPDQLHSCCGFTEGEALRMAQKMLPKHALDMSELKAQYGGYYFPGDDGASESLLHPQLFVDRISRLLSPELWKRHRADDLPRLLSSLFKNLPLESLDSNTVTIEGLIQFIASGGVVDVDELDDGPDLDGTSVYWGALYHAGALTRCRDSRLKLRVVNGQVLSFIHSCIDERVRSHYDPRVYGGYSHDPGAEIQWDFLHALYRYNEVYQEHQHLMNILSRLLRDQTRRSLGRKREPTLQGVLELMMRNAECMPAESMKFTEPIVLLPPDATRVRLFCSDGEPVYNWELTTLTLRGMWFGANPTSDVEPGVETLRVFHEELCQEDEEQLLARPYRERGATRACLVRSFFKPAIEYTQVIAVGGASILRRPSLAELNAPPPVGDRSVIDWDEWDYYRNYPWVPVGQDEVHSTALNDARSIPEEVEAELFDCQHGPDFGPEEFTPDDEDYFMAVGDNVSFPRIYLGSL